MKTLELRDYSAPVFASQSVHSLFPTPIWIHALRPEDAGAINDAISAEVAHLQQFRGPLQPGGMYQSQGDLADRAPYNQLRPFIESAAAGAMQFLSAAEANAQITSMWLNVSARMTAHRSHSHPNNFLSGVYYAQVDERSNVLTLEDPRPQANVLRPHYLNPTEFNSGVTHLRVQPGWLVLFPAFLSHSVPPSDSDRLRVTVAFNIMLADFVSDYAPIAWKGNVTA
jgi:uncharacterized protein (TIGR02466 family)